MRSFFVVFLFFLFPPVKGAGTGAGAGAPLGAGGAAGAPRAGGAGGAGGAAGAAGAAPGAAPGAGAFLGLGAAGFEELEPILLLRGPIFYCPFFSTRAKYWATIEGDHRLINFIEEGAYHSTPSFSRRSRLCR